MALRRSLASEQIDSQDLEAYQIMQESQSQGLDDSQMEDTQPEACSDKAGDGADWSVNDAQNSLDQEGMRRRRFQ